MHAFPEWRLQSLATSVPCRFSSSRRYPHNGVMARPPAAHNSGPAPEPAAGLREPKQTPPAGALLQALPLKAFRYSLVFPPVVVAHGLEGPKLFSSIRLLWVCFRNSILKFEQSHVSYLPVCPASLDTSSQYSRILLYPLFGSGFQSVSSQQKKSKYVVKLPFSPLFSKNAPGFVMQSEVCPAQIIILHIPYRHMA